MKFKHSEFHKAVATARTIAKTIAHRRGYTVDDVMRQSRLPELCRVRWEIWAEAKKATGLGRPTLGKVFRRDQQTIYHGIRKLAGLSPLR
jgi:chromosomal replication initiation ATPase DnaA